MKRTLLGIILVLATIFVLAQNNGWMSDRNETVKGSAPKLSGWQNVKNEITIHAENRDELIAKLKENAESLDTSTVTIVCSKSLWAEADPKGDDLISRILFYSCGVKEGNLSYIDQQRTYKISNVEYYPGWKIVHAVKNGTADAVLTDKEQEAYRIAADIAEQLRGRSDLDKEIMLHDALCSWVTYTNDETTDEDDCAIGAILNGKANCDGYADAFYLLCRLAGLEAGYIGYDTYSDDESNDEGHVWNLVRVENKWTMVDVTWDDTDGDLPIIYAYFNIGRDRAAWTHIWDDRTLSVPWIETTDPSVRTIIPVLETRIASSEDLEETAEQMAASLAKQIVLMPDDSMQSFFEEDGENVSAVQSILNRHGIASYALLTVSGGKYKLIHDAEYYPEIIAAAQDGVPVNRCASKAEMEEIVRYVMRGMPTSFVLWYQGGYDFESNSEALAETLYVTGCQSFSWKYNDSGRVEVSEIEYYPEIAAAAQNGTSALSCSSRDEMAYVVRSVLSGLPESFVIWYRDGYDFESNSSDLAGVLYQAGCESFSWSYTDNGRAEVSDIVYYPEITAAKQGAALFSCSNRREMEQTVRYIMRGKPANFVLWYRDGYDFPSNSSDLSLIIYKMGAQSFSWSHTDAGRVQVSEIEYSPEFGVCETREELSDYILACTSRGVQEFRVYLPDALYRRFQANNFSEWFQFLRSLSIPNAYIQSVSYNDETGMICAKRN